MLSSLDPAPQPSEVWAIFDAEFTERREGPP